MTKANKTELTIDRRNDREDRRKENVAVPQERRAKVQDTFSRIRSAAQDAKDSLPAYQSDLKDLRTVLSSDLTVAGIDASKKVIEKTKASGLQVQKNLDKLIDEMNSVATAITAARVTPSTDTSK